VRGPTDRRKRMSTMGRNMQGVGGGGDRGGMGSRSTGVSSCSCVVGFLANLFLRAARFQPEAGRISKFDSFR
jgi:hypothetical protein